MNVRRRILGIGMAVAALGVLLPLTGCGEGGGTRLRIVGSTSVFPFAEMLAEAYENQDPAIEVDVQAGGSTVGIISAREGLADIGTSSRDLRDTEKDGVTIIEIARDGIAVVVHPSNKVSALTKAQIRDIYAGKTKNWKEVGGEDAPLAFVTREEGSGTRGAFTEIVMGKERIHPSGLVQDSNGAVREAVANSPHAIGYISLALVNEEVRAVAVDGTTPTPENLTSGKYPVVRPFLFVVQGTPRGEAKKFIDFVLGDAGQKVLKGEGLLSPVNP